MPNDLRDSIAFAASFAALQAIKVQGGVQADYKYRDATAITIWVLPGEERTAGDDIAAASSRTVQKSFSVPSAQAGLRSTISNKALTTNVATITTRKAHGFVANQLVRIRFRTADTVFDGVVKVKAVPTTTTFTYDKTNANVASVAAIGVVEAVIEEGDSLTISGELYEIRGIDADSLRSRYVFETELIQPKRLGAA